MNNFLIFFLVLFMIGVFPIWPHSAHWGYYPGGGMGLLLVLAIAVLFMRPKNLN